MAKQLNVNLAFTADTGKAKAQLQDLNRQLDRLVSGQGVKNLDLGITKEINEGISAAASLKAHLQDATNVNTGKLDLTKFTQSLQKSGKTLDDYAKNLQKLGPQGSEAFLSLARSISNAEVPLVRVNKKLEEMWTTLKNTARWQISSSILHGFMGSVQSAFGYAEDLNESLNNIRIVTGQNVDQMADFAKEANKAAKALSTTTTEYTNASLIYYQQGLSEEEVLERADVTVKMANVANQSAEIVSDQMTAVWNNFYDGSKSLEYYADVMTALGAATASSTDEIAGGLEKFAAIADTIGLSYEYAASALATITSNTRQSEEVVGTALKTIFARIQGLNLGETLEDGVTLNKYSEALNKVGISIFEQNGELKAMDNILNEMGDKWGTLNKAQQTALAQTVAGVRQYNQLISLMDNWDKGDSDSFQANLKTVEKAEGALDEQADIYAESWEAASDRVRAAAEAIYSNLINDEFFIDLLDFGADALTTIDKIMDSLGGMPGILSVISAIILKTFRGKIVDEIEGMTSALVGLADMEGAKAKSQATKKEAYKKAAELATKGTDKSDPLSYGNIRAKHIQDEAILQDILLDKSNQLNELQLKEFQSRLDGLRVMQEEAELQAKTVEREKEKTEELVRRQKLLVIKSKDENLDKKETIKAINSYENLHKSLGAFDKMTYQAARGSGNKIYTEDDINRIIDMSGNTLTNSIKEKLNNLVGKTAGEVAEDVLDIYIEIEEQAGRVGQNLIDTEGVNLEQKNLDEIAKSAQKTGAEINDLVNKNDNLGKMVEGLEGDLNSASASTITWRDTLVQSAEGIVSITGGIIALKGAFNSLSEAMEDGSLSMDEFIGFCTSLSMALPALVSGVKALGAVQTTNTAGTLAATVAQTKLGTAVTAVAGHFGIALGPVGVFAAILAGVAIVATGLVHVIDKVIVTEEEAREKIDNANQALEDQNQIVNDLNNSLQTTKERIDELNNKDTLTIVEQEELEKLKEELNLLERQKALEEDFQKTLKIQAAETIRDNFDANYSLGVKNASIAEAQQKVNARDSTLAEVKASLKEDFDAEMSSLKDEFNARDISEEEYNKNAKDIEKEYIDSIKEVEKAYQESTANWYKENKENIQKAEQDYLQYAQAINSGLIELDESDLEEKQEIIKGIRENLYSNEGEYFNAIIKPIFDSEAFQKSKDELLDSLHVDPEKDFTFSKEIEKQLRVAGINAEEFSTQLKQIYTNADEILKTVEAPADFIKSLSFEDLQIINESNFDTTEFDEFYRKFLEVKNQKESLVLNIQIARDTAKDALSTLASGDFLSEEQLTNLEEHFRELYDLSNLVNMSMYDQAKAISSALLNATMPEAAINNTINKVGELREALGKLQEEEEALAEAGKELDDNKRKQKIELEVELDQAKKDLESLKFDPIELSVEIDNSLIDGLMAQAGAIDKATSLISEGFKVEAKNVSELVKTMPELFENATVDIKTGIVQLQNDIVNKTIETAKAETEVERQGLIERLNARITYLNGSIDSLNTLRQVAEANSNAVKLKDEINSKLTLEEKKASAAAIIKAKIQQAVQEQTQSAKTASHVIQDQKQVADASKVESETLYANWQQALSEFNEAAFNAFKNASTYQTQFTNNETVTRQALDAKTTIAGRGSSYQWNSKYDDTAVGNQYSQLQDFIDSGFDFSKMDIDHGNDIQAQITKNQIQEQFKDLFGIDLKDTSVWGSNEESFLDQFFGSYTTSGALLDDIGLGASDLQYELAEAIEQLSKTTSFDGALKDLKDTGIKSGSKSKVDKNEIVERYKEINDQLDNVEDAMSDVSKEMDRLYGANKIEAMKKQNALILKEKKLLEEKKAEAEKNLILDKQALETAAARAGVKFEFDGDEITNYTEQMTILYNQLNLLTTAAGDSADKAQQNAIETLQKKIDDLQAAIKLFEETRELIEDTQNKIDDKDYEWQDNNYEQLSYALEVEIDINDADLKELDYYLDKYADNFYKMAEAASLMRDKIEPATQSLIDYEEHQKQLESQYSAGQISQAKYIEGLQNVRDGYYDNLEALIELDKEMMHYYEDTLDAAKSELDDYTDHMEHLTGVFDHYLSLMDILGKSKDFEAMGNFLEGKASTIKDRLDVAKEYYNGLLEQKEIVRAELDAALLRGDQAAIEQHQKEWDAIVDAADEAQEEVLSLTEEWATAMKEVINNNMSKIADTLEKALTNGVGFDKLMDDFDKLNTRQEEYLTKTNQIYETNKLMRTASKALDETDNKVAKQKLKNFIDETKSLQENTQLSEYELEIQQAKYDLLLAELALEEAKNAKSTVRLSRDNEGNFGYVYTADQDKISDAQQELENAENDLYNLSLEGQQKYTEKYLQAQQQMFNELDELWKLYYEEGAITEEEYKQRFAEIQDHYYGENGVLTTYSNLYNIAVRTDADATADNWQSNYGAMTQDSESWKTAVNNYYDEVMGQTAIWEGVSEDANTAVQGALDDSEQATKDLKDESTALKDELVQKVVPAIQNVIEKAKEQTTAYANQRTAVQNLIREYEGYIRTLNQAIAAEARLAAAQAQGGSDPGTTAPPPKTPTTPATAPTSGADNNKGGGTGGSGGGTTNSGRYQYTISVAGRDITRKGFTSEAEARSAAEQKVQSEVNALTGITFSEKSDMADSAKRNIRISTYATGGYTGDWGPEGKLAVLHEKELVLNKEDTENLLKTVTFIRDIISQIDSQANAASIFNLTATTSTMSPNEILEQSVTIHAEFPNATNHSEIEEAFNNLVNRASQYANRK